MSSLTVEQCTISSTATARCLELSGLTIFHPKPPLKITSRRAFFGLGSLVIYLGKQNPLSASEVVQVCVMPVCLYRSENWLLTDPMLLTLETFQAEIGKRILNLSKHYANLCPLIFLNWPTMWYRILMQKLSFLHRLLNSDQSTISVKVLNSLTNQAPGPHIIQQCKFLEKYMTAT